MNLPMYLIKVSDFLFLPTTRILLNPTSKSPSKHFTSMLSSDKKQHLATGEEPLSLLCLGDDLLRGLARLDCMGRQELSNLRLCCKVFFAIVDLVEDSVRCVWRAFDGTTAFRPSSNSTHIDLRQVDPRVAPLKRILNSAFFECTELVELNLPSAVELVYCA